MPLSCTVFDVTELLLTNPYVTVISLDFWKRLIGSVIPR